VTYAFKVESRNVVGYSDYSTALILVAAQAPSTPIAPVTSINEI